MDHGTPLSNLEISLQSQGISRKPTKDTCEPLSLSLLQTDWLDSLVQTKTKMWDDFSLDNFQQDKQVFKIHNMGKNRKTTVSEKCDAQSSLYNRNG